MRKNARGFTIIELLVVIAVIGILTAISVFSFSKYQANARDSQRSAKATVIAEALEKYYDHNGEYPSCSNLTQIATTVDTAVLPGIDPNTLLTPKSAAGDTNSIKCAGITTSDIFSYTGDTSANCTTSTGTTSACLQWTLQYREEGTGNIISIQSRRKTLIATSGTSAINATPTDFTQINVSWATVSNAVSYQLQRATDAGFTTNIVNTPVSGTSSVVTGLAYNTNYYFRVAPIGAGGDQGNWSNTTNATTWMLTQPTITATAQSFSQINTSWGVILHATSYEVQVATNSAFTTGLLTQTTTGTTSNFTGLAFNTSYYFRVHALGASSPSTGPWSTTGNETTWGLSTPSASAASNSSTAFTVSWGSITHAANYTVQLSSDGTTWSTGWQRTGITGTSSYFGGATQGWKYYVRVQAINGSYTSGWSATATTVLPIDTPSVAVNVNSSTTFTSYWAGIAGAQSYNVQCSSDNATWGSGCAASTTATSFGWGPTYQGRPLYFRTQAVGQSTVGAWSASVGATTWIDTPSAPTYQGPASFKTSRGGYYYYAVVNYQSYCPGGTDLQGPTYHTVAWGQNFGPHPFGFNDWWETYNGVQANTVEYYGHYYCSTPWTSSAWSPESYDVVTTYL